MTANKEYNSYQSCVSLCKNPKDLRLLNHRRRVGSVELLDLLRTKDEKSMRLHRSSLLEDCPISYDLVESYVEHGKANLHECMLKY